MSYSMTAAAVSYTHLDVYKRQGGGALRANHSHLLAHGGHQLNQVVDERVLMIDDQDHGATWGPPPIAARMAEALASVSASS